MYEFVMENEKEKSLCNLKQIEIRGLFGRYDVCIPFDERANIFIGENGLGKTTILNCIYYVLIQNYYKLEDIQFSEISVMFKSDKKKYSISREEICRVNRRNSASSPKYRSGLINRGWRIIRDYLVHNDYLARNKKGISTNQHEELVNILARELGIRRMIAEQIIDDYFNGSNYLYQEQDGKSNSRFSEFRDAISKNVDNKIIYLPTYRRIEDNITSLNLDPSSFNESELLIKFGMEDVQKSIKGILDKIRDLSVKNFTEMTGILLKQYVEGITSIEESVTVNLICSDRIDIIKIILERIGDKIQQTDKDEILYLIESKKILDDEYLHLLNLLDRLIETYDAQSVYDDKLRNFAKTCNKYLQGKQFIYDESNLKLMVVLSDDNSHEIVMPKDLEKIALPLSQLSSGEKQIVSLFSRLYLESGDNNIVIIDEPELSLSLYWQKMLIPDIMQTDKCDLLLTVTHSPFIFANEFDNDAKEMRKYITKSNEGGTYE